MSLSDTPLTIPRGFHVFDADAPAEHRYWLALWERWPGREVFGHPGYQRLFARRAGTRSLAAVYVDERTVVIYPFGMRALADEPWWPRDMEPAFDIATTYAYGGPFMYGDADGCPFWACFDEWAARERVVSEFVRFSLFDHQQLPYTAEREQRLWSVVRWLDDDESVIWNDVEHKVRKNVNKARRSGVRVVMDETGERADDFHRILTRTLDRRAAGRSSYFDRVFFDALHDAIPGQFAYFHALAGGAVVSTELVLVSEDVVYSFLGGTEEGRYALRPNDLLKYEIILWAKAQGKRCFVLGAGAAGDDGVLRYKRSFAPRTALPFSIGSRVLLPDLYGEILRFAQDDDRFRNRI